MQIPAFFKNFVAVLITGLLLFIGFSAFIWVKFIEEDDDYALEANYLHRFTNYISWPNSSLGARFDVAFLGPQKGYENLNYILSNKSIQNRKPSIHQFNEISALEREAKQTNFQIVFLGQDFQGQTSQIINTFAGRPTLIVGEERQPIRTKADQNLETLPEGMHAKFFTIKVRRDSINYDDYLVFKLDPQSIEDAGLKVESELISLASQGYLSAKHKQELAERDILEELQQAETARLKADSAKRVKDLELEKSKAAEAQARLQTEEANAQRLKAEAAQLREQQKAKIAEAQRLEAERQRLIQEGRAKEAELIAQKAEQKRKEAQIAQLQAQEKEQEATITAQEALAKQQKAELATKKAEVKALAEQGIRQRNFIIFSAIAAILLVIAFLIYRSRQLQKKANEQLAEQNEEILQQNEEIAAQRDEIEQQSKKIAEEREKSEQLLLNILPVAVANELKTTGKTKMRKYQRVSILFTDFKGFSRLAAQMDPDALIEELNDCFGNFDRIIAKYNMEKIKTIGDAYMCAGGIPETNYSNPVDSILAGLDMQRFMKMRYKERKGNYWRCRLGINTGEIKAGVIGTSKFAYDIWGDAVNKASRMESGGEIYKVNISDETYDLVKDFFDCTYRGEVEVKNGLVLKMYFVDQIKAELSEKGEGIEPNALFKEKMEAFVNSSKKELAASR